MCNLSPAVLPQQTLPLLTALLQTDPVCQKFMRMTSVLYFYLQKLHRITCILSCEYCLCDGGLYH